MACHETKYCPRCNTTFECKVGNILLCQCNGITLSDTEKDHIAAQYNDCLCRSCLLEIKQELKYKPLKERMKFIFSLFKPQ